MDSSFVHPAGADASFSTTFVSCPLLPNVGDPYTHDERELVEQWLKSEGLSEHSTVSPRADSVIVEASVAQIEKLLNADYEAFGKVFQSLGSSS